MARAVSGVNSPNTVKWVEQQKSVSFWVCFYLITFFITYGLLFWDIYLLREYNISITNNFVSFYENTYENTSENNDYSVSPYDNSSGEFYSNNDLPVTNEENNKSLELIGVITLSLFFYWGISLIGFYYCIVHFWKVIPQNIARIEPQTAAWLSLIPVYNFYWWFRAFQGLSNKMNKTAQQLGTRHCRKAFLPTIACCYWIIYTYYLFMYEITVVSPILILGNIFITLILLIYLYDRAVNIVTLINTAKIHTVNNYMESVKFSNNLEDL
ncbi:MAG: hypothetical protein LBC20_04815 [Planctomycetaceae bacterium]|nr:hypothetical protein [Planctomycetaceae bacterium]